LLLNTIHQPNPTPTTDASKVTFSEDFKRFFTRGVAALLPTLITLTVIVWLWNFLWEYLGRHIITAIKWLWFSLAGWWFVSDRPVVYIRNYWSDDLLRTRFVGVLLAIVAVYFVGLLVGNLIGRTFWKAGETMVMKIPIIRAIYPAVKQVTDFLLTERKAQFQSSRVVAVEPHEKGIWSIGLVTGPGLAPISESVGQEMVTVFVPSSPTAFSGYVLVVPRAGVIELPITVEEAMRMLVSGGVIVPESASADLRGAVQNSLLRYNDDQKSPFRPEAAASAEQAPAAPRGRRDP
jgi:uncharacterized membrane protein